MNVWPWGPWLKITLARITMLRIVTRIAPITSEVSSARVMIRISLKQIASTPASPINASHHHCEMCVWKVLLMNCWPNSPISIVEPQPIAV